MPRSEPGARELLAEVEAVLADAEALHRDLCVALAESRGLATAARLRALGVRSEAELDPSWGDLARALRKRLPSWAAAAAMPPAYGGPSYWPRALAGRSQLPG